MATTRDQQDQRQAGFIAEFEARLAATRLAEQRVSQLQQLSTQTPTRPAGSSIVSPDALDLAMREHVRTHAELTAFLRDTPSTLGRQANEREQAARNAATIFEREQARQEVDSLIAQQQAFLVVKASQGWAYPTALDYQIGQRRVISDPGGTREIAAPTNIISSVWEGAKQWVSSVNQTGTANLQALRDAGVPLISDYQACVLVLNQLKSALLWGLPIPDVFRASPRLPLDSESVGTRIWRGGVESVFNPSEETCPLQFRKDDLRQLSMLSGFADDAFLADLAALDIETITFNLPTELVARFVAADAVLQGVTATSTAADVDAMSAAALEAASTPAGLEQLLTHNLQNAALDTLDDQQLGALAFNRVGDALTLNTVIGGQPAVVLASIDLGASSDAGVGLRLTGIQSFDGEPLPLQLDAETLAGIGLTVDALADGSVPRGAQAFIEGLHLNASGATGWPTPTPAEVAIPQGFERRIDLPNGFTLSSTYDSDRRLIEVTETYAPNSTTSESQTYAINADGSRTLRSTSSRSVGMDGSYVGTDHDLQARQIYRVEGDADGNTTRRLDPALTSDLRQSQTATVFSDVSGLVSAIRAGDPIPALASGVRLVNSLSIAQGAQNANLAAASNVAAGVLSFYNLYNAISQGNDFDRVNATLTSLNYANQAFGILGGAGGAVSNFLNGTGIASGSVGVLPALGLIAAIRAKDPVGMAMSVGTMISGAPFLTSPVGWALIGASILRSMFDDGPPDAWGVARVTFGEGFQARVEASGENFGPDQARARLQSVVDVIGDIIARNNQGNPDSTQHLGLIPQRMPQITYRASEFRDPGFAVQDVDALTGAQRMPSLRFGEDGQPFGMTPGEMTPAERALLTLQGAPGADPLVAYMLNSALQRGAIAPMWEVQTARLQQQAGDPNAGYRCNAAPSLAIPHRCTRARLHRRRTLAANGCRGIRVPMKKEI